MAKPFSITIDEDDIAGIASIASNVITTGTITANTISSTELMFGETWSIPNPNSIYFIPKEYGHRTVHVTNSEGVTVEIQVDTTTNTVKVDFEALMELLRLAGYEEGKADK